MKKLCSFLTLVLFCLAANAQQNQSAFLTKSLVSETIRQAHVETSGGNIEITSVPHQQARVEVYVRPSNRRSDWSDEDIKQALQNDYELDVSVNGSTLTAIARNRHNITNWKNALNISFKIYVDKDISTDLRTSGGGISLSGLSGDQNFQTSGGGLDLEKLSGHVNGRTSGGGIHIMDSKSNIDLRTSGGGIDAERCSGQIRLSTSGGPIHLQDMEGTIDAGTSGGSVNGENIKGELKAGTSGGRIDLKNISGSLEASTSGGGMHVSITELGNFVRISNSGGSIDLEIPQGKGVDLSLRGDRIHTGNMSNFNGKIEDDVVDGTLNGGGIPVTVRSGGGTVNLSLR